LGKKETSKNRRSTGIINHHLFKAQRVVVAIIRSQDLAFNGIYLSTCLVTSESRMPHPDTAKEHHKKRDNRTLAVINRMHIHLEIHKGKMFQRYRKKGKRSGTAE
jgi:hypothetical protein